MVDYNKFSLKTGVIKFGSFSELPLPYGTGLPGGKVKNYL